MHGQSHIGLKTVTTDLELPEQCSDHRGGARKSPYLFARLLHKHGSETADQLEALTRDITVAGLPGKQIRLLDPPGDGTKATIGLMVVRGDSAWFFKLTGDRSLVKKSEKDFDEFLGSYQFLLPRP